MSGEMSDTRVRRGAIPPYEYQREVKEYQDYIRVLERAVSVLFALFIGSAAVALAAAMELQQLGVF